MLPFKPTNLCPKLPAHWQGSPPQNPLPELTDDDIDLAISEMIVAYCRISDIPRTRYGRRAAVRSFMWYQDRKHLARIESLPPHYLPGQPR